MSLAQINIQKINRQKSWKSEHNKAATERIRVIVQIEKASMHRTIAGAGSTGPLGLKSGMDFWDTVPEIMLFLLLLKNQLIIRAYQLFLHLDF